MSPIDYIGHRIASLASRTIAPAVHKRDITQILIQSPSAEKSHALNTLSLDHGEIFGDRPAAKLG